ncbi:soluble adenylyl cyclase-like protein [Olivibacter sp. XZL3]|uniref:soluble adenylyl cyclase-like protein n=1 Tax=Olivibacter sp. XZL3 TaxID=1735116 RepID=UPI0010647DF4|nr:soluble adenylyl cyclase-like protein [Olivibacter sp. XZL3]
MKVQENQVIDYLKEMRETLLQEIKSIDKTIEGITGNSVSDLTAIVTPSTNYAFESKASNKVLQPVEEFDPHSKLDNKISYALTNVGQGFKEDILDVLQQAQPDLDPYKLEKVVAVRLSYLLKNGFIEGRKIGRRFEYSFVSA